MSTETELRHAVIDRLIAASLRDVATTREATLQHWRSIGSKPPVLPTTKTTIDLEHRT